MKFRQIAKCLFLSASALSAGSSFASVSGSESPDTVTLSELNVVAVKQLSELDKLALSSSSLSTAAVERLNIADIKQISDIVPNFFIPEYGSRITSSIYVRGIGARMDQPAVGLNIDNVPVLNKDAYDFDIADIERIEMLRGPQSSLYGRNTMTGLVNIRTVSPMKYQGWRMMLSATSSMGVKASAGWYHKFNSNAALGVSLGGLYEGGQFRNKFNGKKVDKEYSGNMRVKFQWQPLRNFSLSNTLASSLLRQGGYPYAYIPTGEINYNDTCFYRRFLLSDGLTMAFHVGEVKFTSVTSLQHIDDNMTLDQDFLPDSYFNLTQKKRETSFTEDFMARGSAADGRYSWLGGLFAFYRHLSMDAPVTFLDEGISSLIESHRNSANPAFPIRWESRSFPLLSHFTMPSFGVALYHESRLNLGNWTLTAGLRLDYEDVSMHYNSVCHTGYEVLRNPSLILPPPADAEIERHSYININDCGDLSRHYLTFLPKVSALFNLPSGLGNVYLTVGKGYKAGGFNTQMFSDVLQQRLMTLMGIGSRYDVDDVVGYKPEECWSYEVGSHLDIAEASLSADISLFYIDVRNQQLTRFPPGSITGRIMTNAGKTRSFGGELSLRWNPSPHWSFNTSYGYTNARFREYSDGRSDFKGKRLPYAPSNTLWLQGLYTITSRALGENRIVLDLNLRGVGDIYWNEDNTRHQPFYALLGASATFSAPSWEIQLWGRNLTDTRYDTFYFLSMGNEFLQRGRKLECGFTLRYSFR